MDTYIAINADGAISERTGHPVMDESVACHGGRVIRLHDTAEIGTGATVLTLVLCLFGEDPSDRRHPVNLTATAVAEALGYDPLHRLRGEVAVGRFAVAQTELMPLYPGDLAFITAIADPESSAIRTAVVTAVMRDAVASDEQRQAPGRTSGLAHLIATYPANRADGPA